jgi:hypothetical protein
MTARPFDAVPVFGKLVMFVAIRRQVEIGEPLITN